MAFTSDDEQTSGRFVPDERRVASTPAKKQLSTTEKLLEDLADVGKGALFGGPVGMGVMMAEKADKAINYAANEGGGKFTEFLARQGVSPETAAKFGVGANVAIRAVPAVASMQLGNSAAPSMKSAAEYVMQSAVKPERAARLSGDADKAISTMLTRGINATAGGMEATQAKVTGLEKAIQGVLDNSPAVVDKTAIAKHIQPALDDVALNLDKAQNVKDINNVLAKFINHDVFKNSNIIPVSLANKMKQAFTSELRDKAFVPGADLTASALGQKALASGIRQEVGAAEPAVLPTLKEQSELINVLKVLGPRVSVEGNKNLLGLGALSPSMQRTLIWMLDRWPASKSFLAHAIQNGSERIPQLAAGSTVAAGEGLAESIRNRGQQ